MKIPNKLEIQQTAFNHSSKINYDDFKKTYRKCIIKLNFLYNIS